MSMIQSHRKKPVLDSLVVKGPSKQIVLLIPGWTCRVLELIFQKTDFLCVGLICQYTMLKYYSSIFDFPKCF